MVKSAEMLQKSNNFGLTCDCVDIKSDKQARSVSTLCYSYWILDPIKKTKSNYLGEKKRKFPLDQVDLHLWKL